MILHGTGEAGGAALNLDHADTLEACARGDRSALRNLFEAEGPRLLGVAQRILHRRELAEEALQEGFAQIWRSADRFDRSAGSARGWIYAIVRNKALNMLRDAARETNLPPEDLDRLRDSAVETSWDGLDPEGRLRQCLGELDPSRRQAILLAYVAGLTHGEIAGKMRIPLGTAKAWVRRTLIALRDCMT
jgi:RNA polymerase sigma-70 factor, ECF subfamily